MSCRPSCAARVPRYHWPCIRPGSSGASQRQLKLRISRQQEFGRVLIDAVILLPIEIGRGELLDRIVEPAHAARADTERAGLHTVGPVAPATAGVVLAAAAADANPDQGHQ